VGFFRFRDRTVAFLKPTTRPVGGISEAPTIKPVIRLIDISPKQREHHDPKKSPDHAAYGDQGQETNE
jgi:hypothetical protein